MGCGASKPAVNGPRLTPQSDYSTLSVQGNKLFVDNEEIVVPGMGAYSAHQGYYNTPKTVNFGEAAEKAATLVRAKDGMRFVAVVESATVNGMSMCHLLRLIVAKTDKNCVHVLFVCASEDSGVAYKGGSNGGYHSVLTFQNAYCCDVISGTDGAGIDMTLVDTAQFFAMKADAVKTVMAGIANLKGDEMCTSFDKPISAFENGFIKQFDDRFCKRAGVHWFVGEGMEEGEFEEARNLFSGTFEPESTPIAKPTKPVPKNETKNAHFNKIDCGKPRSMMFVIHNAGSEEYHAKLVKMKGAVKPWIQHFSAKAFLKFMHTNTKYEDDQPVCNFNLPKSALPDIQFLFLQDMYADFDPDIMMGVKAKVRDQLPGNIHISVLFNAALKGAVHSDPFKRDVNSKEFASPLMKMHHLIENDDLTILATKKQQKPTLMFINQIILSEEFRARDVAADVICFPRLHFATCTKGDAQPKRVQNVDIACFGDCDRIDDLTTKDYCTPCYGAGGAAKHDFLMGFSTRAWDIIKALSDHKGAAEGVQPTATHNFKYDGGEYEADGLEIAECLANIDDLNSEYSEYFNAVAAGEEDLYSDDEEEDDGNYDA